MSLDRLITQLDRMQRAGSEIGQFLQSVERGVFLTSVEKQRAVSMNLVLLGDAASCISEDYPEFVVDHPDLPWHALGDFRNRIAQGYFDIEPTALWDAAQTSVPELLSQLDSIRHWRAEGE
jgi:uncharacterized protein with HEPN domain